ncbi:uncharacterized protein LOC126672293 [Mercurialis annua]|uniref:uncharacterized protein LOC126672293 n=1 Tax=Mercurialis annua TaxID=3986 RepID=UPI00215E5047|nr:uncharacterized protein LOC126672293 [Mercurialis annua]
MYQVYQKLKVMRKELRTLNKTEFSNIEAKVKASKDLLGNLQKDLLLDPFNENLHGEERAVSNNLIKWMRWEENILRQKSRILWIKLGDQNSKFFHRSILQRQSRKKNLSLKLIDGSIETKKDKIQAEINGNVLDDNDRRELDSVVLNEEIKAVIFSIKDDKSLGPNGYSSDVFKSSWNIVGEDVTQAIMEFLNTCSMLRQTNSTIITLIPEKDSPEYIGDYKPIACCNVIYKGISKILTKRISRVLNKIINPCQYAFFPDRGGANRLYIPKQDYQLDHELHQDLYVLNNDQWENNWILFLRKRLMVHHTKTGSGFGYHKECRDIKLNHLCFADDMFLFSNADTQSIKIMKDTLESFIKFSGLAPKQSKSTIFFNGISEPLKMEILSLIGFTEGTLSVRYLGLPLVTTRLLKTHCNELINRITYRVSSWSSKSLSYAGRIQLINSVLMSMQIYWCSVFLLPKAVIQGVEAVCRNFLWNNQNTDRKGGLVSWKKICCNKCFGGLGIKYMITWNKAALIKHIWGLISLKPSLWATWVNANKLKRLSFWGIEKPYDSS